VTDRAEHARKTSDGPVDTGDQCNPHPDQHTDADLT